LGDVGIDGRIIIKLDLQEIWYEDVGFCKCIDEPVVSMKENFLTKWGLSIRTLLHGLH
jgi:hypothetical protein